MEKRPSPNFDTRPGQRRPDMLLLHYTGMESLEESLVRLTDPAARVSAHYLIDEAGSIYRLVGEDKRAWHAGVAHWAGEDDINGCSIGIELQNPGHEFGYRTFPEDQMTALVELAQNIVTRHAIPARRVLGHSDVAPGRKEDPGELFDWRLLAEGGVGLWPGSDAGPGTGRGTGLSPADPVANLALQRKFRDFGYGLPVSGDYCAGTRAVVTAFQRHWRPDGVSGEADAATLGLLEGLLQKSRA